MYKVMLIDDEDNLHAAIEKLLVQNGYAFCGSNAWRAEKIQSVRELMTSLRTEYDSFAAKCEGFSLREKLFGAK